MTYQINKTDGTIVSTVPDGQIDKDSTDITLIGRNFSGFGEFINENFIKILENFSNTTKPEHPIKGQLWYDSSEGKLKVYNGNQFVPVSSATLSGTQPNTLGVGDLWFNSNDSQLYFYDGSRSILIGPAYSNSQGISGFQIKTIFDTLNQQRIITLLYNGGILLGIFSKDAEFTPKVPIIGYTGSIRPGFNAAGDSPLTNYKFNVTATNAENLGGVVSTTYLRKDTANEVLNTFKIKNDLGLDVGTSDQLNIRVSNSNVLISNNADSKSLTFSLRKGIVLEPAISINADTRTIGLYDDVLYSNSQINIGGSVTIAGNLTVEGNTVTINAATLVVEDKNVILAKSSGVVPTDANASGGGLIVQGANAHALVWSQLGQAPTVNSAEAIAGGYNDALPALASGAWNSTEHINLASGKYYAIDGVPLLEQFGATFRLTSNVTQATGLNIFGVQAEFTVDNLFFNNNRISTLNTNGNIELEPNGTGNIVCFGSPKIVGVADPTSAQDVATKEYVDNSIQTTDIVLSLDLSDGKPNSYIIVNILNNMCPPGPKYRNGTQAVLLCTILSNNSTTVDLNPLLTAGLSFATFVTPGPGTAPAVTNSSIGVATLPAPTLSTTRIIKRFQISAGVWAFISDTLLPP